MKEIQGENFIATDKAIVPYYTKYKKLKDHHKTTEQIGEGQEKKCFKAGHNRVLLKYKINYNNIKVCKPYQSFYERQKFIKNLQTLGVKTPLPLATLYTHQFGHYYELQQKAHGECLAYFSEKQSILKIFGEKNKDMRLEDLRGCLQDEFVDGIFKYNIQMQNQLKSAPKTQVNEFLQNYKLLTNMGISIDGHTENIFYHPTKGFSFIDINDNISSYRKTKNDNAILDEIFTMLNGFNKYAKYMKGCNRKAILNNTETIKQIFFNCAKKIGYKLNANTYEQFIAINDLCYF